MRAPTEQWQNSRFGKWEQGNNYRKKKRLVNIRLLPVTFFLVKAEETSLLH